MPWEYGTVRYGTVRSAEAYPGLPPLILRLEVLPDAVQSLLGVHGKGVWRGESGRKRLTAVPPVAQQVVGLTRWKNRAR